MVSTRRFLLNGSDHAKLAFVYDQKACTARSVQSTFYKDAKSSTSASNWIARMTGAGMLEKTAFVVGPNRAVYAPTRQLHKQLQAPYSFSWPGVSFATLHHTLAVADYASIFFDRPNVTLLPERYLEWQRGQRPRLAKVQGLSPRPAVQGTEWIRSRGGYSTHTPDMIIEHVAQNGTQQRVAVEIELSVKSPTDYVDLFCGYWEAILHMKTFTAVHYVLPRHLGQAAVARFSALLHRSAAQALSSPPRYTQHGTTTCWSPYPPLRQLVSDYLWTFDRDFTY